MKGQMHRKKCYECRKTFYCLAPNLTCLKHYNDCACFLCTAKLEEKVSWLEFRAWVKGCFKNIDKKKRLWLIAKMVS